MASCMAAACKDNAECCVGEDSSGGSGEEGDLDTMQRGCDGGLRGWGRRFLDVEAGEHLLP